MNVPDTIGLVVASRFATLHELSTVYGLEDLYNLLEIAVVDKFNNRHV